MLRVFYARRRVNFRRQDLCLFKRLVPHSGARAWEHRFMEATWWLLIMKRTQSLDRQRNRSGDFADTQSGCWYQMCKTRKQSLPDEGTQEQWVVQRLKLNDESIRWRVLAETPAACANIIVVGECRQIWHLHWQRLGWSRRSEEEHVPCILSTEDSFCGTYRRRTVLSCVASR